MRIMLDTNILLDLFTGRKPFAQDAVKLLAMQAMGDAALWASAKSTTDIFYIMSKQYGNEPVYAALTKSLDYIHYCSVSQDDVTEAIRRKWPDFEDCIVAICAEKTESDVLITRDKAGFAESSVPAMTTEAFFEMLQHEYGITYDEVEL